MSWTVKGIKWEGIYDLLQMNEKEMTSENYIPMYIFTEWDFIAAGDVGCID